MPKRLFVSSSLKEALLADEAITQLSNAFEGDLTFANASQNIVAGDKWKEWIRKELDACDAGLFLVTPAYVDSQWLSAEFTALWLSDKPIYILLIGGVRPDQLFRPVQDDYQATDISDKAGIAGFLRNLSSFCGRARVPYQYGDLLSFVCQEAFEKSKASEPAPSSNDPEQFKPNPADYPKHHLLFESDWLLSPNDDHKTMRGECVRTEHFVCQSGTLHYVPVRVAQAANIVQLDPDADYPVELIDFDYPNGRVSIDPIGVSPGKDFSFHIRFTPALTHGTAVKVTYRFAIPQLKAATSDHLRDLLQADSRKELRNFESFVIQVLNPTDQFNYGIRFAPGCFVEPETPDVTWRRAPYHVEAGRLLAGAWQSGQTPDGGWQMRLERANPVVDTRYTLRWRLPRLEDLT